MTACHVPSLCQWYDVHNQLLCQQHLIITSASLAGFSDMQSVEVQRVLTQVQFLFASVVAVCVGDQAWQVRRVCF